MYTVITGQCKPVQRVLGSRVWAPFARLNYSAYLVHEFVIAIFYYNLPNFIPFTVFLGLYLFIGHTLVTYLGSTVLFLLVEQPVVNFAKILKISA